MTCIFVGKPPECVVCLDSLKLQCLLNHRHLVLTPSGRREVVALTKQEANNPARYKTVSGQEQRPR